MERFPLDRVEVPMAIRQGEWFSCVNSPPTWQHAWHVTAANHFMRNTVLNELATGKIRSVQLVPLHKQNRQMILESGTETDRDYLASPKCNPRVPILSVPIDGVEYIIDGWHRARRAIAMGWDEIPAFAIPSHMDKLFRICRCCGVPTDGVNIDVDDGTGKVIPLRVPPSLAAIIKPAADFNYVRENGAALMSMAMGAKQGKIRGRHPRGGTRA